MKNKKQNLYKISLNYLILLLVALFFLKAGYSQSQTKNANDKGNYIIKNYHPSQYRGEGQNWSIIQDTRGLIYVANLNGVFEFDGVSWRLIKLPGNAYATSLALGRDSIVYVGSHSNFGYLESDNKGKLQFFSLLDKFPEEERAFSFIWDFYPTSHGLYFYSYEKLFKYNNDTIVSIDIPYNSRCFSANDNIYLFEREKNQLLQIVDDKIEIFIDFNKIDPGKNHFIINGFSYNDNELMFVCLHNGYTIIPNNKKELSANDIKFIYNQEAFSFLIKNETVHSIKLENGNYAFATIKAGIIILDENGSIVNQINKHSGLQNESVNYIKEDNCNNLWLALDNGISTIGAGVPITYFDNSMNYDGTALDLIKFKNTLYIATWQGMYYLEPQNKIPHLSKFIQINSKLDRGWKFQILKNNKQEEMLLLGATSKGIYTMNKKNVKLISPGMFYTVVQSETNNSIVLAGGFDGLILLNYNEKTNNIKRISSIPELEEYEIHQIEEGQNLTFWLSHRSIGVSSITFCKKDEFENAVNISGTDYYYVINHYTNENGLPESSLIDPFKFSNNVYFKTNLGIFTKHLDRKENRKDFSNINYISKVFFRDVASVSLIKVDQNMNIWLHLILAKSRERILVYLNKNQDTNRYRLIQMHFSPLKNTNINQILFDDQNDNVWFAGDDAIVRFDMSKGLPKVPECTSLIRKIIINNNEVFYGGGPINNHNGSSKSFPGLSNTTSYSEFPYTLNNINFDFAAPLFHDSEEILYATYLENFDKDWSSWKINKSATYPNLPPGTYTFRVKARDLYGNETNSSSFSFIIKKPWFKTHVMYVVYSILLALLILIIVRVTNKKLFDSKVKLEKLVKERTSEIARQRQQIEIEKEKSDKLLRSILPNKVAQELKTSGNVKAQYYDVVSVVFMDFKGFSKIAQYINPFHLIAELDKTFGEFDDICVRHNIEKIKTMGDAYLCAAGIPIPTLINPFSAIFASFEILAYLRKAEKDQWLSEIRIGIHTGELIAGVIGKNKFTYDIWGETVNTAARMEQSGTPMKINISGETYEHIKDYFECSYRGKLPAKHKDEYDMYFVNRIKKEYSADDNGQVPNQKFLDELSRKL